MGQERAELVCTPGVSATDAAACGRKCGNEMQRHRLRHSLGKGNINFSVPSLRGTGCGLGGGNEADTACHRVVSEVLLQSFGGGP
jgi:hypothetical protein